MIWTLLHPKMTLEHLGMLPAIFNDNDPRPAKEQIEDRYSHGGGYTPQDKWAFSAQTHVLRYPGDPPLKPIASSYLPMTDETLYLYPMAFVCIVQSDGSFAVTRMD